MPEEMIDKKKFFSKHDIIHQMPPVVWDDGLPLGNGDMGIMLWGDGNPLYLTMDKVDVWDLRKVEPEDPRYNYSTVRQLAEKGEWKDLNNLLQGHLEGKLYPTKISLGRMELDLRSSDYAYQSRLSLYDGTIRCRLSSPSNRVNFVSFIHAEKNIFVLRMQKRGKWSSPSIRMMPLALLSPDLKEKLEYPAPLFFREDGFDGFEQVIPGSVKVVVMWTMQGSPSGKTDTLYLTAVTSEEAEDPRSKARVNLQQALRSGFSKLLKEHISWWHRFWNKSLISIPDFRLETLWYFGLYKLASSSREGKLPANLQGLWPTDGQIPPWRGDYHNNMNTQETYWPVYSSNHQELGLPFYDMLINILPSVRERTKRFFGWDGARFEAAMVCDGTPVPGWATVQYWPGTSAWLCHHFWLHYLYSQDRTFLREKAYPFMKACMQFYEGYLELEEDGYYHVPLSHAPEYWGDEGRAWGKDPNCDLMLIRNLTSWIIEASQVLGMDEDLRSQWEIIHTRLCPYLLTQDKQLMIMRGVEHNMSHCLPSHLLCIFPLGDLNIDGSEQDRTIIDRSLSLLRYLGMGEWTGWSYPFVSLIYSRAGKANAANYMLQLYMDSFININGFHLNGDFKKNGLSIHDYRPYTMEAECAVTAAISEMLLQSWGKVIRIFPTAPANWRNIYFQDLRAEGAFLVSALKWKGRTVYLKLKSEAGGICRIANPFENRKFHLTSEPSGNVDVVQEGKDLIIPTVPEGQYVFTAIPDFRLPENLKNLNLYSNERKNWLGLKAEDI